MALYKMSELAPMVMAEINEILRLATDKEKLPQSADRETISVNTAKRARRARGKQLELELIRRN